MVGPLMGQTVVIGFAIYLLALLIAPLIAAFRVGVRAALTMALAETGIVVASWLAIPIVIMLVEMLAAGRAPPPGSIGMLYESVAIAVQWSMLHLLAIPMLSIVTSLLLAWVGLALRAIWRGLRG
jgi:hypothetical protein